MDEQDVRRIAYQVLQAALADVEVSAVILATHIAADDHTGYALLAGRAGGQNLGLGTKTTPGYTLDTTGSINLPQSASEGLRFGGTALLIRVEPATPGVLDVQPSGNSVTNAFHLTPTGGTLPTGTLVEYVLHRTLDQAFGGNYGRWSFTALGTDLNNVSGIYGEFGGTVTPTEFLFTIGVENPASTFTSYEPMRFMAGTDLGNVGFGIGSTTGRRVIQLQVADIGSAGTRDSHSILWRGKSNDGSDHAVDWQMFVDVTSNAGASTFKLQSRVDAGSFTDRLAATDGGSVIVGNQAALATDATDGFLYVPSCAGTPTGTPTAVTGKIPLVWDSTNKFLYFYDGGWKKSTVYA